MVRLPSKLWVEALIRTVEVAGSSAFVVQKGDAERGDTLIKVSRLDGTAAAYTPSTNLEGERVFRNLLAQGVGPDEASVDAYIKRARSRDSDLWVVEIEDREGRHFLTEDIED
ncbi:DUF1491 family protein [Hyphomonas chukchiensis]|uniref:DUF1491 domain-containing protein n=1 Tax=Hyphomonas chukchiensis TaxID=1280947 RepID=A0A062UIQ9_9PROT|nr:DUF1491 family protein [Hyphomonas chukchiensis]KCZ58876.1 hypothetical protein HY30_03820 [Hyphomonas chukchiensis]|tara:strand:+ start:1536 stop:1874 length:339 start_codon:yes stop_codon:yes gene_type:complete